MKYRVRFHKLSSLGHVWYKVQLEKFWGWQTVGDTLSPEEVNRARNGLNQIGYEEVN